VVWKRKLPLYRMGQILDLKFSIRDEYSILSEKALNRYLNSVLYLIFMRSWVLENLSNKPHFEKCDAKQKNPGIPWLVKY